MLGAFKPRSEDLQLIVRPGVDDVRVRTSGVRGQLIQATSVNFVTDFDAAAAALDTYLSMKDGTAYEVVQYGTSHGDYLVIDVSQRPPQAITAAIGGTGNVQHVCDWILHHIAT